MTDTPTSTPGRTGVWAGVDVGGRGKGFHVALIEDSRVIELVREHDAAEAAKGPDRARP